MGHDFDAATAVTAVLDAHVVDALGLRQTVKCHGGMTAVGPAHVEL